MDCDTLQRCGLIVTFGTNMLHEGGRQKIPNVNEIKNTILLHYHTYVYILLGLIHGIETELFSFHLTFTTKKLKYQNTTAPV
jgi:hypothetical protein